MKIHRHTALLGSTAAGRSDPGLDRVPYSRPYALPVALLMLWAILLLSPLSTDGSVHLLLLAALGAMWFSYLWRRHRVVRWAPPARTIPPDANPKTH